MASYKELGQRAERFTKVRALAMKMSYDRELMGKGRKRKLKASELTHKGAGRGEDEGEGQGSGVAGPVYKWKRERKK